MRKWRGKEFFAVTCCACAWILAAFYFFPHEQWKEEAEQAYAEQAKEEQEIVGIENFMNAHRDMEEFSRETAMHQEMVLKALPEDMEQGAFLEFLQRLAIGHQIELLGVFPGKSSQEKDGVMVLPVQVKMNCSYFQLLDFLRELQEGERFLQVRNARIHSDGRRLTCQLDLAIFAMKS